ncbi:MAG: bifunctional glutamate N-acetyltransferase/amino-acid acetyltransferase ArgJ [Butyrivibrio sp.]|nr:bifunctional glutamate N-acetyltransferase/amino-acid acetyltransferase ArgJ [Butyrivibrio sp.]
MQIIDGGVTAAAGFEAASYAAGIKYQDHPDMALVYSTVPCRVAGTFTSNVVKAAPVQWDRRIVQAGTPVQAVVVNTGFANAGTGAEGLAICETEARAAAEALGLDNPDSVLIGSTGVIGGRLPMDRIRAGIEALAASRAHTKEAGTAASKAIMTTDTRNKEIAVSLEIGGKTVTLGAMSKGSGMIHPNMCTMLCYICTDAAISKELLQKALSADILDSFNLITVDGDTSTNDTVLLLANGLAGNPEISSEGADYDAFCEALRTVTQSLARRMAGDGEGATALIECRVEGAADKQAARTLARSVVGSQLVKAAVFGHDANWGRILCALGYAGVSFDPLQVDIALADGSEEFCLCRGGVAADYSEERATELLGREEVVILARMHQGEAAATAWGCNLTLDYVKINADYRS